MRDFDQVPLRVQTQRNRRLEMRVLLLPHRAARLFSLLLFLLFTVIVIILPLMSTDANAFRPSYPTVVSWLIWLLLVVRHLMMPSGHTLHNTMSVPTDSVDHIVCRSDRAVSRCEKAGIVQEKTVAYAVLHLIIETKDLLCLYDSPTTAIVIRKADLRSEELEQLRATILKPFVEMPPPQKDIYRKVGWWKARQEENA